jgi:CheY-like chemotaxis protein
MPKTALSSVPDLEQSVAPGSTALRLLHIEDNPSDATLMQEYLRGILPSVTFDTALRLGEVTTERTTDADCALLDLSLPDASGLDALLALREMSDELPIIVLTGFDDMAVGLSAVRFGADDYLVKNHVDGYTLERAVQYAIERRRLLLQLDTSIAETIIAQASTATADAAMEAAMLLVEQTVRKSAQGAAHRTVTGTHEVAVRIDRESRELVLSCQSCEWVSERSAADGHSWVARALEAQLLRHVYFAGFDEAEEAATQED